MQKVVIWHYNRQLREAVAHAFQSVGCSAYAAPHVNAAWQATLALRPDVVLTDFPALFEDRTSEHLTLTEAIRSHPELDHVAVYNLLDPQSRGARGVAEQAGVSGSIPGTLPPHFIVAAVERLNAGLKSSGHDDAAN